jgi:pimeloyl-CoA synthetase
MSYDMVGSEVRHEFHTMNFTKIRQMVQELLNGTHTHARARADIIKPHLDFIKNSWKVVL